MTSREGQGAYLIYQSVKGSWPGICRGGRPAWLACAGSYCSNLQAVLWPPATQLLALPGPWCLYNQSQDWYDNATFPYHGSGSQSVEISCAPSARLAELTLTYNMLWCVYARHSDARIGNTPVRQLPWPQRGSRRLPTEQRRRLCSGCFRGRPRSPAGWRQPLRLHQRMHQLWSPASGPAPVRQLPFEL